MIAWTDVETTGLDENTGDLLEVALVVTNDKLEEVHSSWTTIRPPISLDATIAKMDPYVKDMHTKNGLIEELRNRVAPPPTDKTELESVAEWLIKEMTEAFKNEPIVMSDRCALCKISLSRHEWGREIDNPRGYCKSATPGYFEPQYATPISVAPLAGSTVSFDRRWIRKHLPSVEALFSHRSIDVSVIAELAKRFAPDVYNSRPRSTDTHRALPDARGSVALLKHYLNNGLFTNKLQ